MARWLSFVLTAALVCAGCQGEDDGTTPIAANEELPPLQLTEQTRDLLLTWIDERGGTHTAVTLAEIPESGRDLVRVITKEAGHGRLFYVANLKEKQADGSYSVRTMPRGEWEALIERRRNDYRAKHAPPPPPPPPIASGKAPTPAPQAPITGVQAIVYGAEWCGPCHQAQDWLKRKKVPTTYYDIDRQPARADEMRRKLRAAGRRSGSIPVVDIGGELIVGYSPSAMERALAKAKSGIAL